MNREELIALCLNARKAQTTLARSGINTRNAALEAIADRIVRDAELVVKANTADLEAARASGMNEAMCDRLRLDRARIEKLAASVRKLKALPDPLGKSEGSSRPNGLKIQKVSVPLGNVAVIYEARPNVTVDIAAICIKSGNAAILRGGKEAYNTNTALETSMRAALDGTGIDPAVISLVHDTSRASSEALMKLNGYVDVLIPRGGKGLINTVVENASVPVIETGAGNCHIYVDSAADFDRALKILINAKVSRPSVCNSAEKLLVHADIAERFLPLAAKQLAENRVELRGDGTVCRIVKAIPAAEDDLTREYNDYIMTAYVVPSIDEAIAHINTYSTHHSEAIITEKIESAEKFCTEIDSAAVYVNSSTRFTDGEEFGLGAEIGISTQKLHVRGPFALEGLTTYKYLIVGNGQTR